MRLNLDRDRASSFLSFGERERGDGLLLLAKISISDFIKLQESFLLFLLDSFNLSSMICARYFLFENILRMKRRGGGDNNAFTRLQPWIEEIAKLIVIRRALFFLTLFRKEF